MRHFILYDLASVETYHANLVLHNIDAHSANDWANRKRGDHFLFSRTFLK